jgi:uncharacterized protein (TIGR00304 family)
MKRYVWLVLVISGIALIAYSVSLKESTLYLAVIIPIVTVSGLYGILGIVLIVLGMIYGALTFLAYGGLVYDTEEPAPSQEKEEGTKTEPSKKEGMPAKTKSVSSNKGAILFVGPIPIVFGSDKKVTKIMLVLAITLFIIVFVGFFLMYYLL